MRTIARLFRRSPAALATDLVGLVLGITAFLLIRLYVDFETSYDRHHPHARRLYRLRVERTTQDGQRATFASCAPPAGLRIREQFPDVDLVARCINYPVSISHQDKAYLEKKLYFAEPELIEALSFDFAELSETAPLAQPNQALLSESAARRYFGNESAMGKQLELDRRMSFEVVGVFKDSPARSHIKFDMLLSYASFLTYYGDDYDQNWGHTGAYTYVRMAPDGDLTHFRKLCADLVEREFGEALAHYNMTMRLVPDPVTDIHLHSHHMQEVEVNGQAEIISIIAMVGVFILLLAWINYVNLATARSMTRAREIGLKKVVGASRAALARDLLTETAFTNGLAVILSVALLMLFFPLLQPLLGLPDLRQLMPPAWWLGWMVLVWLSGTLGAGVYPALVLTRYMPGIVLRGQFSRSGQGQRLRKVLVVLQFVMAMALLTGTWVLSRQISYMQAQSLGFDIERTLVVASPRVRPEPAEPAFRSFTEASLKLPAVNDICHVTEVPGRQLYWDAGGIYRRGSNAEESKTYHIVGADHRFAAFFNLKVVAGRAFSLEHGTDADGLLLNERACATLGFESPEDAVGKAVTYWGKDYSILGVLANYHQQSPKADYEAQIYRYMPTGRGVRGQFAFKLNAGQLAEGLEGVKALYNRFFPGNAFEQFFLDDYFNQQYQSDEKLQSLLLLFTILALSVVLLGLWGLTVFDTQVRRKEIGIRKVLGGSVHTIIRLFIGQFLHLFISAVLLALPLSLWGSRLLLAPYSNQLPVTPALFITPVLTVLLVTLLFLYASIVRAAQANPVDSLQYE